MPPPPRPPAGRPGPTAAKPAANAALRPPAAPLGGARPAVPGRPATAVRPPTPAQAARTAEDELEGRFNRLDRRIQQLKVDYNRFFAGDLPQPPQALRDEIEAEMRRLRAVNMRRSVDGFRFSALEAQLSSYSEMYSRRLRAVEEGKVAPRRPSGPMAVQRHDADAGIVLTQRLESDAVEALFAGLVLRNGKAPTMDLDTFRDYLQRQVAQIRDKTGCEAVQFRVASEEGKVKLKAKPVGAAGGSPP